MNGPTFPLHVKINTINDVDMREKTICYLNIFIYKTLYVTMSPKADGGEKCACREMAKLVNGHVLVSS